MLPGYSAPVGVQSIVISPSVCLSVCVCVSVCPEAYLSNGSTDLNEIWCADSLWLWLGPAVAALHYVKYFRLYG